MGPLTQTTTYTLTCTGAGGSINRNANVTVSGGSASLQGSVDSSYVDRFGDNRIYVFSGSNVTPDDYDGDAGDPVATVQVNQDENACTFGFAGGNLAAGNYTIAFTQDAASDVPGAANTLVFVGQRNVTVGASGVTSDFRPSGILTVGPGKQFATLALAQAAAVAGSVIEIDAGTYTDDVTVWRPNNVTIRGVGGGRAHIAGNRVIPFQSGSDRNNGMGLMVIRGTGISVENIEFSGARVADENGAGIRNQGRDLTICNGYFHDGEDGYLGEALGTLLVEYSEFHDNGTCPSGGCNHNLYIDGGDRLIFRHNYSHHSIIGHTLKTRAAENYILYNRLMDEQSGSSSYNIDVPNGGLTYVIGNLIQQGPNTDNSSMLNYGTEGLSGGRYARAVHGEQHVRERDGFRRLPAGAGRYGGRTHRQQHLCWSGLGAGERRHLHDLQQLPAGKCHLFGLPQPSHVRLSSVAYGHGTRRRHRSRQCARPEPRAGVAVRAQSQARAARH